MSKKQSPRILVCEFHQETNSFNPIVWDMEKFKSGLVCEGETLLKVFSSIRSPLMGMFNAIKEAGGEIIPGCAMRAQSGGLVDHSVLELFISKTITAILEQQPLDGIFISLHGATQTTKEEDACGLAVESIREAAGKEAVIAICCDLHANITDKLVNNADFISGYLTYPHIDYYETGYRAAKLGMQRICGDNNLYMAYAKAPMIVPASGYTSSNGAFKEILDQGARLVEDGEILDFTVFQMQPWLDVSCATSSVIVIASRNDVAQRHASAIGKALFDKREEFWPKLISIDEVIDIAEMNDSKKPVLLVDAADSPNAGAVGDSVAVVLKLLKRGSSIRAATIVTDPDAVLKAFEVGIGNKAMFRIGAGLTPGMPGPLEAEAYVQSLHDGIFTLEGPAGRGMAIQIGRSAVLKVGTIDILVCQNPGGTGDPQIYRHFGIEPFFYQLLVVKANTSFREPYAPIAADVCVANTPGAAAADLVSLPFQRIPKDRFYPFADI